MARRSTDIPGGVTFVELIRLAVVILVTGGALQFSRATGLEGSSQVVAVALGAGVGYVVGGMAGRFFQGRISQVERRLQRVPASEIVAGAVGMMFGLTLGAFITWPVLLFGAKIYTYPIAAVVV